MTFREKTINLNLKTLLVLLLSSVMMITGCSSKGSVSKAEEETEEVTLTIDPIDPALEDEEDAAAEGIQVFVDGYEEDPDELLTLDDERTARIIEDELISSLEMEFLEYNLEVRDVESVYYSKEYLEEREYNAKENIYFGYTLQDIIEAYQDLPFIFTLGENGETVVEEFKDYDDTNRKILTNLAIGSGVLAISFVCVIFLPESAPAVVKIVLTTACKRGIQVSIGSSLTRGLLTGITSYLKGEKPEEIKQKMALSASKGFVQGAIIGTIGGGFEGYFKHIKSAKKLAESTSAVRGRTSEAIIEKAMSSCHVNSQSIFLNGESIASNLKGSTRPDLSYWKDGIQYSIEVKNYDLEKNLSGLKTVLNKQLANRVANMPEGTVQRVILDVTGRNYTQEYIRYCIEEITRSAAEKGLEVLVESFDANLAKAIPCS